jgi:hypothetical protein
MRSRTEDTQNLLNTASDDIPSIPVFRSEQKNCSIPMVSFTDMPKSTCYPQPSYQLSWFQQFQETWFLELLGLFSSAAGLVAIMAILVKYDGKERPTWYISINAVVSILSAVVSIGALYSVTHGVSQLKWVWLSEKERSLADLQAFDSGSRGVMGALALIIHLRARYDFQLLITLSFAKALFVDTLRLWAPLRSFYVWEWTHSYKM